MPRSTPPMPVELIDMIVEHLHPRNFFPAEYDSAKRTLCSCALVSRTWHSVVRPHLFREIGYSFAEPGKNEEHVSHALCSNLPRRKRRCCRPFSELETFLTDVPSIARFIRKLSLRQRPCNPRDLHPVDYSQFLSLLQVIPLLQDLVLANVLLKTSPNISYPVSERSLVSLTIHYTYDQFLAFSFTPPIPSRAGLKEAIACASKIETLTLIGIDDLFWPEESTTAVSGPTRAKNEDGLLVREPPIVHCVALDYIDDLNGLNLVSLFENCFQPEAVRSLKLLEDELPQYCALVRYVGPYLHKLEIFLTNQYEDDVEWVIVHPCVNLQELIINIFLCIDEEHYLDSDGDLNVLLRFLTDTRFTRTRYPQLSTLILQIDMTGDFAYEEELDEWELSSQPRNGNHLTEQLDELFTSIIENTSIPKLSIQWADSQVYIGPECEAYIREMFPTLSGRDLLEFRDTD